MLETARIRGLTKDSPFVGVLTDIIRRGRARYHHMAATIMCNGAGHLIANGSGRALMSAIMSYVSTEFKIKIKLP
ncbi:hypothetical protein A3H85_00710 [Candidatus Daviesbacteria bacterium RIFCSPLOWO2_02_FULL_40_8]|nr:MAG: hypothetical protein A3H85_00710 [Candidatus Daviesbacteria bacterium RIFCSPLOWO2_02_FULL_40_8]